MQKRRPNQQEQDILTAYGLIPAKVKDAVVFTIPQGDYILKEGDPISYLYFVVAGKAKVCRSVSNGKQLLLCFFLSEGIIGDLEMMTEQTTAFATLQAVTDFTCIALPLSRYAKALRENPIFMNHIARGLAKKLIQSDTNSAITILHSVQERLCAYICQTAQNDLFHEMLTDVASLLGTSYRHLLRCLDRLCLDGVLKKSPCGYLIIDAQELKCRAGDFYLQ